jgi:hypothetical protein
MARQIVSGFWEAMGTNDFKAAAVLLHPDFEYFMPQTNEYLLGPKDLPSSMSLSDRGQVGIRHSEPCLQ